MTDAQKRASRNYRERLKRRGLCVRGCGSKAMPGRVNCSDCSKRIKKPSRFQCYREKIKNQSVLINKLNRIVDLQHIVIKQLREQLNGRTKSYSSPQTDSGDTRSQETRLFSGEQSIQ